MEIIGGNPTSKCLSRFVFASLTFTAACLMIFSAVVRGADDVETLLIKMEAAYDEVKDYQTDVEVKIYKKDGTFKTERSLYTFKKQGGSASALYHPIHE